MIGEELVVTCVTTESAFLRWSSDEYIGEQVFAYSIANQTGSIQQSTKENTTFANLTRVSQTENILGSQLHILVLAEYPTFSVACLNPGNNVMESISFVVTSTAVGKTAFKLDIMDGYRYMYVNQHFNLLAIA